MNLEGGRQQREGDPTHQGHSPARPPRAAHLLLYHRPPAARQVSHDAAGKPPGGQGAPVVASVSALCGHRGRGRGRAGAARQLLGPHSGVSPGDLSGHAAHSNDAPRYR